MSTNMKKIRDVLQWKEKTTAQHITLYLTN